MAGTAKTTRFMMGTATLMIGTMDNLYNLNPSDNGIGLVKNFTVMTEPSFVDLGQGATNSTVFSKLTGNPVKATAEVFEYTAQNLTYGLGLDGTAVTAAGAPYTLSADVGVDSNSSSATAAFTSVAGMSVGDYHMFANPAASNYADDNIQVGRIASIASLVVTYSHNIRGFYPSAFSTVTRVNSVNVGSTIQAPFLSVKAVGALVDGTKVEIKLPKVRITKGFTMAWNADQFGNMPFEMDAMDLVPTDTFYPEFLTRKAALHLV